MGIRHALPDKKRGQSLVEMAIIAPILLIMFIGVVEVGWGLRDFVVLQNATREAARFGARGRYLDFSKISFDDIGYPYVVQHELDSISSQLSLSVSDEDPSGTIIVSHVLVDTGKCGGGTEDDLILSPLTPGYGHYMATFGQPRPSRVDFAALVQEMRDENETFNCDLEARNPGATPSVNSVIIVESFYAHDLIVNVPLVSNLISDGSGIVWLYTRTIMRITADARGQIPSAGQGCEVYPIALHTSTLAGHQSGDSLGDIFNGAGDGNFGWLRWNDWPGHNSQTYLVDEILNPRLSFNTYVDASDPSDTTLNAGDWIWGLTGVVSSDDMRDELNRLVANHTVIRVPVWDIATESGSNLYYHVVRFVKVQLTGFDLDHKWISAIFVGEDPDACPDVAIPTPAGTTAPGAGTPTATATSTETPTPTSTPIAPIGCNNPLPSGSSSWVSLDIGGAAAGYTGESGGAVYVCGSGGDIGSTSDQFRYAYQVVESPNVQIIARVADWNGSINSKSKAGLMIRNATAPSSAHGMMIVTGDNGTEMVWRASDSGPSQKTTGGSVGIPVWFKLVKLGSIITSYRSADGVNWTQVDAQTVNLGSTYLVGMAVTSHNNGSYAYATFDSITVDTAVEPTPTPTNTPTPTVIASDDFESGGWSGGSGWSSSWSASGEAAVTSSGTAHAGSYHLRLLSYTGVATRTVNMSGVSAAHLQLWWKADSWEGSEYATISVNDGAWHTVLTVSNGQDDNTYHYADIDLSSYSMVSNFQVRIESHMGDTSDYFYVDDIVIVGQR
jgi:hypothetical protein